jgi:hypothetical protein
MVLHGHIEIIRKRITQNTKSLEFINLFFLRNWFEGG